MTNTLRRLSFACLAAVCACTTPEPVPPVPYLPAYLNGFTLINDDEYAAVGSVLRHDGTRLGTGVLVSQSHVLTAGHVVEDGTGYWFETNGHRYCIANTVLHPYYKVQDVLVIDLAVVSLAEPCPETPIVLSDTRPFRHESLTAIGMGGDLRRKSNEGVFWYYGTLQEDPFDLRMLCHGSTLWYGDSGGAVLNSRGTLVGIVSALGTRYGYVYDNSAVRVDVLAPWVREQINR